MVENKETKRWLTLEEIKDLLVLPWESLNDELDHMEKSDLKSIIAYASGYYQAGK